MSFKQVGHVGWWKGNGGLCPGVENNRFRHVCLCLPDAYALRPTDDYDCLELATDAL